MNVCFDLLVKTLLLAGENGIIMVGNDKEKQKGKFILVCWEIITMVGNCKQLYYSILFTIN